jgi:hypothetical protein
LIPGEKALAEKKFIKGEARFYSQDEDALSFIKEQLLDVAFKDIISKEMVLMGLDSKLFWKNFQEKFEGHFKTTHEKLKARFEDDEGKMKPKDRQKYQKLLRLKRLKARKTFGRFSIVIHSYVIKRMSRSLKYPNSRYMRLLGHVDKTRLRSLYARFVKLGGKREFKTLYLSVNFELQEVVWQDLGVAAEADFTEVIKNHWLSWFSSRMGIFVKNFKPVNKVLANNLDLLMSSQPSKNPDLEEFSDSLWLKINFQIGKDGENTIEKKRSFSFQGSYLLIDLQTQKPLDFYDFPKVSHKYSYLDNHQLGSNIASYIYRVPLNRFEHFRKKLEILPANEKTLKLEVKNITSIQEILEIIALIKERGVVQNVEPQISYYDRNRALLRLDYRNEYNSLKKILFSLNQYVLGNGRSILLKNQDSILSVYLKGEIQKAERDENKLDLM